MGVVTCVFVLIVAGFNGLVDPYKLWHVLEIKGFNSDKTELMSHERIFKIVGVAHQPGSIAILGTSRSRSGLDSKHPALQLRGKNLAIGNQPYRETRLLFEHQLDRGLVKNFVIGLDFYVANSKLLYPADFDTENYAASRPWQLLFSTSTFTDAFITVVKNNPLVSKGESSQALGLDGDARIRKASNTRKSMAKNERYYLSDRYAPPPSCAFHFLATQSDLSPLDEIRAIFKRAYSDHIALKLLISPSHARQWETLANAGLWNKWEAWKRQLVAMNETEARHAGQPPFPLWDFSGYNSISTETVPPLNDTQTLMRWYFDSSHYTPAAGDLVLDRIFNFKSPERTVPEGFGVLLTAQSIEAHLARIRVDRVRYRQTHPEDVAEIETLASEISKNKRCKPIPS